MYKYIRHFINSMYWSISLSHFNWISIFCSVYRYLAPQLAKKSNAWTRIIQNSNSHKSRLTLGTKWVSRFLAEAFSFTLMTLHAIFIPSHLLWVQIFHKRMPPEAVDLVSRLLQYSPSLRCTAVSILYLYFKRNQVLGSWNGYWTLQELLKTICMHNLVLHS